MINDLSNKITFLIKKNLDGITEEKEEIINYGINLFINEIITLAIIFSIAILTGLLKYVLVSCITYGILRTYTGGAHAKNRIQCALTYTFTIFGVVLLSKYLWAGSYYPAVLVFVINMFAIFLFVPGDTVEKPILSRKMKRRQKIGSIILSVLILIAAVIVWHFDRIIYNVIVVSTIPVTFFLTPVGYRISRCKHSYEGIS